MSRTTNGHIRSVKQRGDGTASTTRKINGGSMIRTADISGVKDENESENHGRS